MCHPFQEKHHLGWHINFQKWSDAGVFCTFRLGNVLRATTACNFSSLIWPHGSAPAALASLLFATNSNHWKNTSVLRLSYLFAHLHLLSSHFFSSLTFSLLLFSSLTLPTSAFPSVHIVGSLTSKLPWTSMSNHIRWDNATTNILLAGGLMFFLLSTQDRGMIPLDSHIFQMA